MAVLGHHHLTWDSKRVHGHPLGMDEGISILGGAGKINHVICFKFTIYVCMYSIYLLI